MTMENSATEKRLVPMDLPMLLCLTSRAAAAAALDAAAVATQVLEILIGTIFGKCQGMLP